MAQGRVPSDEQMLVTLAEAQFRANDLDESVRTLLRAAARFGDSAHYLRAAELQIQLEQWKDAAESLELALKDENLAKPSRARLLLGIAHYERGDARAALQAFELASRDDSTREQAQQWLHYLQEIQLAERGP